MRTRTHSEDIKYHDTGNGLSFISASAWKTSFNATIAGVGMLIGPQALKPLNSIEKIQPMVATFNGNPSTTIISCYSPTNVSEQTDLIALYNELFYPVRSIPKHNVIIIGGDMNPQIGKNVSNKFRLHNSSNRNGEHLMDFTQENRLTYLNTKYFILFQKRKGKLWIYIYANNAKSRQRYDWTYEGMRPKQPQPYTMTDPCLTTRILEINIR